MKKDQRQKNAERRLLNHRVAAIILSVIIIGMLAMLAVTVWKKSSTPSDASDYEGRIVDRWADYSNSQYNPQPYFHLLVESNEGKRFSVRVDPNVYESARVGMRIKSRSGQVVLIDSDRNSTSNK